MSALTGQGGGDAVRAVREATAARADPSVDSARQGEQVTLLVQSYDEALTDLAILAMHLQTDPDGLAELKRHLTEGPDSAPRAPNTEQDALLEASLPASLVAHARDAGRALLVTT